MTPNPFTRYASYLPVIAGLGISFASDYTSVGISVSNTSSTTATIIDGALDDKLFVRIDVTQN